MRHSLILAIVLTGLGCDGFVGARLKVISAQGAAIPEALVRLDGARDHDLARFTDNKGCAEFSGVVGPVSHVTVTVGKPGYQEQALRLRTIKKNCLIVHLARDGEKGRGSADTIEPSDCPCDVGAGYSPTMSARFKNSDAGGSVMKLVGLRQSDRPRQPWLQVSDANGCLGVKWIVAAGVARLPLVLEKEEYQPVQLDVPTMDDRCYAVRLSRVGVLQTSSVTAVASGECGCPVFAGETIWPER